MRCTYSIEGGDNASYGVQFGPVMVEDAGMSPAQSWGGPFLLLRTLEALAIEGDPVALFAVTPRYVGDTVESIRESGGVVAVYRILPAGVDEPHDALQTGKFRTVSVGAATRKA